MKLKIYLKNYCPYCQRVVRYLDQANIDYEAIDVSDNVKLYQKVKKQTSHHTVPQVFVDGVFIGGSEDFFNFIKENRL